MNARFIAWSWAALLAWGCGASPPAEPEDSRCGTAIYEARNDYAIQAEIEPSNGRASDRVRAAWVSFRENATLAHNASDQEQTLLFVLRGELELIGNDTCAPVDPIVVPEGGVIVIPPNGSCSTIRAAHRVAHALLVRVSCGEDTFACPEHTQATRAEVRLAPGDTLSAAGGKMSVQMYFEAAADSAPLATSFEILDGDADVAVPRHTHDTSMEILIVESGAGTMHLGDQTYEVRPGSFFIVPRATPHDFTATGPERFHAWQLYTPSGPEQRFRAAVR